MGVKVSWVPSCLYCHLCLRCLATACLETLSTPLADWRPLESVSRQFSTSADCYSKYVSRYVTPRIDLKALFFRRYLSWSFYILQHKKYTSAQKQRRPYRPSETSRWVLEETLTSRQDWLLPCVEWRMTCNMLSCRVRDSWAPSGWLGRPTRARLSPLTRIISWWTRTRESMTRILMRSPSPSTCPNTRQTARTPEVHSSEDREISEDISRYSRHVTHTLQYKDVYMTVYFIIILLHSRNKCIWMLYFTGIF